MLSRMWNKGNISPLLLGVQTYTVTMEINITVAQKLGINVSQDPAIPKDTASGHRTHGQPYTL